MNKAISVLDLIKESFVEKCSEGNVRDLGKFVQFANEIFVRKWLAATCGIENRKSENDSQGNEPPYDIITTNGLRVQAKFRGGKSNGKPKLFLENTRRVSKKNLGNASKSGHVAYSVNEFDVIIFTIPNGNYEDASAWEVLAIPSSALVDPNNQGFIVRHVSTSILNRYQGKAKEIMIELEEHLSNRERR